MSAFPPEAIGFGIGRYLSDADLAALARTNSAMYGEAQPLLDQRLMQRAPVNRLPLAPMRAALGRVGGLSTRDLAALSMANRAFRGMTRPLLERNRAWYGLRRLQESAMNDFDRSHYAPYVKEALMTAQRHPIAGNLLALSEARMRMTQEVGDDDPDYVRMRERGLNRERNMVRILGPGAWVGGEEEALLNTPDFEFEVMKNLFTNPPEMTTRNPTSRNRYGFKAPYQPPQV